ncbi:MAG: ABC transporter ATP-binding protein [Bacillota bacterium]
MAEESFELEDEEEGEQKKPFNRRHFQRMLGYLRPYRSQVIVAGVMMFVATVVNLAEPLFIREAIDRGIVPGNLRFLGYVLAALMVLRVIAWIASRAQIRVMNHTGQKILYDLRQALFDHIQGLSFGFYDGRPAGKIMSRITNDVNAMGELINAGMINLVSQGLSLIGVVILMLVLDPVMALITFATVPFLFVALTTMRGRLEGAWLRNRKAVANINAHLNEMMQGIQVIQAYSRQATNTARFDRINDQQRKSYMTAVRIEIFFWPLTDLVAAIGMCAVVWYGALEVLRGQLTIGLLMAFLSYLGKFWGPVSTFSRVYSQLLSAMASAERVFEILDTRPQVVDAPGATDLPTIAGEVTFNGVSFEYVAGEPVLRGVDFRVAPGQTVAIVGPTGAGKTTIINLLARFYDPSAGRVLIDGHDLRRVTLKSLRSQLGLVLQDTFIFSGTIAENIRYGRLAAVQAELEAAARSARADGFIAKTTKGYETETQERGSALSTGQRQLLAFARAILADPRILILDEATSSIDSETERLIQEALRVLLAGRTAFVIAHRLSTIQNADQILVINGGRIIEKGTHDQLLEQRGLYWRLYQKQFRRQRPEALDLEEDVDTA